MHPVIINRAEQINGWMRFPELKWLAENARNAKIIIEVGSYLGRSARALCDNTDGKVFSVDPYYGYMIRDDGSIDYATDFQQMEKLYENLSDCIDCGKFTHYKTTLRNFPRDIKADLIFIDGDHRYNFVKEDIVVAKQMIEKGGIISGHDYYGHTLFPGVKQAVDEEFKQINICDSIWWTTCE